ncbi:membrane protein [Kineosporia sp. NBRC 101731]|nr:membrane protein [Kineosporia sp. NBRC 101731]
MVTVFSLFWNPLDFSIYRLGGSAVRSGTDLYLERQAGLFFTYTPFAALSFTPLSWIPLVPSRLLWELATVAAFALACREMLLLARLSRLRPGWVVVGGLMLEPVWHTLFLGQINVFLLALVLFDVRRVAGGTGLGVGVGIGVAAAIKLTPGIFIVLLLCAGKVRAAVTAAVTFVACTGLGVVAAPGASRLYWSKVFFDTSRVGASYISNQSPFGALVRLLGGRENVGSWYLVVPLVLLTYGLVLATRRARSGDWAAAVAVGGLTSLVVSPISWSHHWVWALPALVVLVRDGRHRVALAAGAVLALSPMWWLPRDLPVDWLTANAYLVMGLALLGLLGVSGERAGDVLPLRRSGTIVRSGTFSRRCFEPKSGV